MPDAVLSTRPDDLPAADTPTGLRPVQQVIPARCLDSSTPRALALLVRDLGLYAVSLWLLSLGDSPWLLVPAWLLAGVSVCGLFVLGHDAAHGALFPDDRMNALAARLTMLPSLHATASWIYGHNRVHHGHTLKQGIDFVWHPLTVDEYRIFGRWRRLQHRVEWGPFGAGAYYLRNVWWHKMVRFPSPSRWAADMRRDKSLVGAFLVGSLLVALAVSGWGGLWLWTKLVVVPFVLFCQGIGWVVHVQHIHPDIRWWSRRDWNRFRGQVEGTTVLEGPPGWELFFHWIMIHVPHHVDMRIPCYRLVTAADAIEAAFPDHVERRPIRLRDYLHATRICKLYDFEHGRWIPYPAS